MAVLSGQSKVTSGYSGSNGALRYRNNKIYYAGEFFGNVDFDPGPGVFIINSNGGLMANAFLCLDTAGQFQWAKRHGDWLLGGFTNSGIAMELDNNSNIIISAFYTGSLDFDPGPGTNIITSNGLRDVYVAKYDSLGTNIWAKGFGGPHYDIPSDIEIDGSNNIFVGGVFWDTADFDPGPGVYNLPRQGYNDHFISKLDANGGFLWSKRFGGASSSTWGTSITLGAGNTIFATGYYSNTADFNSGPGTFNLSCQNTNRNNSFITKFLDCSQLYTTVPIFGCDSAIVNGVTYYTNGFYTQLFNASSGCDSNVVYNVTIQTPVASNTNLMVCDSPSVIINGQTIITNGIYPFTFTSVSGCDSNVNINITFAQSTADTITMSGCDSLTINGQTYSATGTYLQTLTNAQGCDSSLTLNLILNQSTSNSIIQTGCDSLLINGQTYTSSGVYTQTFTNSHGCDSILNLNLTIGNSSSATLNLTACDTLTVGSQSYTTSGTYSQLLINSQGCDSLLTINATINSTTYNTDTLSGCDSLTINGQTYTTSGQYTQVLSNATGCDSLLTLNVGILNSPTNSVNYTACDALTVNGQTYTSSGSYLQVLPNPQGCDTVLTLNLTINNSATAIASAAGLLLNASPNGANYQWVTCNPYAVVSGATSQTYTVSTNGDYAVVVTQNGCSDTSNCITINNVGVDEMELVGISVYPNPTHNKFTISNENNFQNASFKLLNTLGQLVYKQERISGKELQIDISNLANGIYTIEIMEGKKVSRIKVLKK